VTLALLFPGQGAQHADMLPWLDAHPLAQPVLKALDSALGLPWRQVLQDPARAASNATAQPLLTGAALACWRALAPHLPAPAVVAGYSVGELAAFAAADVFDDDAALQLATVRATLMDRAVAGLHTGLLSVQGLSATALAEACDRYGLALAISVAADRALLGGLDADLQAAEAALTRAGAQCTRLPVHVASHTPWMRPAAVACAAHLAGLAFAVPSPVLVCNHTGSALRHPADLAAALAGQIASPVPWDSCMDTVAERQPRCVLEVGPGQALARSWAERHPGIPVRSTEDFRSPQAVGRWVATQLR